MLWVERLHQRMSKTHCNFSNLLKPESSVFKGLIYQYVCPSSVIPICQYYTRLCYLQATYLRRLRAYSSVTAQVLSDVSFTHTLFSSIKYKRSFINSSFYFVYTKKSDLDFARLQHTSKNLSNYAGVSTLVCALATPLT